jgi:hypothetical protein
MMALGDHDRQGRHGGKPRGGLPAVHLPGDHLADLPPPAAASPAVRADTDHSVSLSMSSFQIPFLFFHVEYVTSLQMTHESLVPRCSRLYGLVPTRPRSDLCLDCVINPPIFCTRKTS